MSTQLCHLQDGYFIALAVLIPIPFDGPSLTEGDLVREEQYPAHYAWQHKGLGFKSS